MQNDEDIMAQIASLEAQLNVQAASGAPGAQPAGFGGTTFGGVFGAAPAPSAFPSVPTTPGQPQQPQQQQGHQFSKDTDDRSIFVAGLPTGANGVSTTPEELAQFFQECGPIATVTVLKDRNTLELKGTAYLEFCTHEAAGRAIDTKNNAVFKGSPILVCWSSSSSFPTLVSLFNSSHFVAHVYCLAVGGGSS